MIRYELKKVVNAKSLLCLQAINILFLAIFQVQLKGVRQAKSTAKQQSIYRKIGGRITDTKAQQIEELKQKMDDILGKEGEIEQKYIKGKIDVDEYMEYRDSYHYMQNRSEEINLIYEKYQTNRKHGWWMIFDRYYEKLFQPVGKQWGLFLSVFLSMLLLVCCETKEIAGVIQVTQKGRRGIMREKLQTILATSVFLNALYTLEEYAVVYGFYPFEYLEAPVQSISCLSNIKLSVTIGQWYFITFLLRMITAGLFGMAGCFVLLQWKNKTQK